MRRYLFLQMFQEIMINRSQPNLLRMLSQKSVRAEDIASLLRTPDADRDGATPFLLACLSGNLSMCRYLEQLGADVHAKSLRCACVLKSCHFLHAVDAYAAAALQYIMPFKVAKRKC
jgi:ankyrin repeat protein